MKHRFLPLLCFVFLCTSCARDAPLSGRDAAALAQIRQEFGGKATFHPVDGLYLDARLRPNMEISPSELEQVYHRFFLDSPGEARVTGFVYLNLYDARGRFLEQLHWSEIRGEFRRTRTERY